ncbi:MAG: KEOPS complex subunit Cgi121 [Thaumarchaeota archaeon]|nr:KEOPS complex subunit Cgi121 [Nitrososphaerota archaeon]
MEASRMETHARAFTVDRGLDSDRVKEEVRGKHPSLLVQSLRPGAARNVRLLEMIAAQTVEAAASGNLIARKLEIDFLLRVAGTTQISRAIRKVGSQEGRPFLLVMAGRRRIPAVPGSGRWKELERKELSERELEKVEVAALLNAIRA